MDEVTIILILLDIFNLLFLFKFRKIPLNKKTETISVKVQDFRDNMVYRLLRMMTQTNLLQKKIIQSASIFIKYLKKN